MSTLARHAAFFLLFILAGLGGSSVFGNMAYAAGFLDAVDDMPLMEGLSETGEGVAFDKPDGRIIRAVATGGVTPGAVQRFYLETLPQLGWSLAGNGARSGSGQLVFIREQERLEIYLDPHSQTTSQDTSTLVRFSIEPN